MVNKQLPQLARIFLSSPSAQKSGSSGSGSRSAAGGETKNTMGWLLSRSLLAIKKQSEAGEAQQSRDTAVDSAGA